MRRKDREITDRNEIQRILQDSQVLRLGLMDDQYPYVLPLHYGFEFVGEELFVYMHTAKEGKMHDLVLENPASCIEIDNQVETISGGENPCRYSSTFASVIARGKIRLVEDVEGKIHGLKRLMFQQTGREFEFSREMTEAVAVWCFKADNYTAKEKKRPQ